MIPNRLVNAFDECLLGFFAENYRPDEKLALENKFRKLDSASETEALRYSIGSAIGFTSNAMSGSIYIGTSFDALRHTHPMVALGAEVTDDQLYEWAGEIANQVMGRLRNNTLPFKLDLDMSLPSVIRGITINLAETKVGESLLRQVSNETGLCFQCVLRFVYKEGFDPNVIDTCELDLNTRKNESEGFLF